MGYESLSPLAIWLPSFYAPRLRASAPPRQGISINLPQIPPQIEASVVQWSARFVVASSIENFPEETLVQIQALAGD
jgi:hypothetical protein